ARDLRGRGWDAWPLVGETQLELELDIANRSDLTGLSPAPNRVESDTQEGQVVDSTGLSPRPNPVESEFGAFAAVCDDIAETTGKLKKRERLAGYLKSLDPDQLRLVAAWFNGRPFPRSSERRATQVGSAMIRQALLDLTGLTLPQYKQVSSSQADSSRTAFLVLQGKTNPVGHSLAEVATVFERLADEYGQGGKIRLLRESLAQFSPAEGSRLIGILTGDLRIGLKEGLLEEAIADAFERPVAALREAHMLTGDLGLTADLARRDALDEAAVTWFTPLKVMLASPEETAEDIVARLAGNDQDAIWCEDKFDGIRAQLHRQGDRVEIYSRDLRAITGEFEELVEPARDLGHDVILDGEIIAYEAGKRLTFFDLQKRLGRKGRQLAQGDLFFGEAVPVRFIAFDLLAIDGEGLLDTELRKRREKLETLRVNDAITRCDVVRVSGPEAVDEAFNEARRRDNEGLIAKDPASRYQPGRRGKQWLKLKKAMPTLDVVVVKAQQGHGKRSHVLSDYTFAVRDTESGELRVVGKAYSGLTDVEIEELTERFMELTIEKRGRVRSVEPVIILEIAFDSINPSKRHDSGLAMRFPRIVAIRRDKTIADIDTLAYARKLSEIK
ncbi:MAG: ATP-dependent DNA ligase, partial [Verrucomicrobiota bacterium]